MGMFTNFSDIIAMARLYMEELQIVSIIYILTGLFMAVNKKKTPATTENKKVKRNKLILFTIHLFFSSSSLLVYTCLCSQVN